MEIKTKFNIGDMIWYLSGEKVYSSPLKRFTVEVNRDMKLFIYYLEDGLQVPEGSKKLYGTRQELLDSL